MNSNQKLTCAILAILGAQASTTRVIAADATADTSEDVGIAEIQVTAQRRTESIQDVPITIQAISGDTLQKLNVQTFDDLIRYTPNITYSGNGPGEGNIFIRGLSSGGSGNQSQSTTAPFPNVALYLDDQSMTFPARNVDVYLVDMERVEVLEGPQGTLFGGGAQAGAVRYITNKPKLDVTEGNVNAGYGITASGGDPSALGNATINIPLIPDTLAVRAVIFDDHRGGYISNVPGTISFPGSPVGNNATLVQNDANPVDYTGVRLSLLYKINDDWNALIQQNYQNMQADGYFAEYPETPGGTPLAPYQITAFAPAYDKDHYESTAWTLNGNIDNFKVVYTGSYLDRHIQQQADYSNYLRSGAGQLYTCTGVGASYFKSAKPTTCYAPVGDWNDTVRNTHQTHELRVTTPDDYRLRATAGGYWEDFKIYDEMNFNYGVIPDCSTANLAASVAGGPDCVAAVGPLPGNFASDPSLRLGSNTAFGEDVMRGYRQAAAFTSIDFDLIPKVLTATGGIRYYHYDEFERGSEFYNGTAPAFNTLDGACIAADKCGFGINLNKTEKGSRSRLNLTYHITPDLMAYATFSQGFRPGGFNRTASTAAGAVSLSGVAPYTTSKTTNQFDKPVGYDSDTLTNIEIGSKAEFWEHRIQLNFSAYIMHWNNVQLPLFDPVHLGNTTFDINGPSYTIHGAELQLVARPIEPLTVQGSASYNHSEQTNAPCLSSNIVSAGNPTPIGTCITQIKGAPYTNPYGVLGTSPAFSPLLQFNVRARYDFVFGDYKPFIGAGANHIGSQRNEPASFPNGSLPANNPPTTTLLLYTMPGYTTADGSLGVAKDNWTAQITGVNLFNSSASTYTSSAQFIESKVPLRPRTLTFMFGYKF